MEVHVEPTRALALEQGLLAAAGVEYEVVYDGCATGCPHCSSRAFAEAA